MAVSFTEIFSSLCQTEKISAERRIVCEVAKIQPFERRLKRILFDELLGTKLFPRCVVKMARGLKMTPYEKALAFVYDLRSKRCYDRANQLEAALEFLTGDCANVLTETDSVLTFLLSLAETSGLCDQSTCKLMFDYTKLYKECVVVPDGELFDSDTTVEHSGSTVPYLMYSDELFDSLAMQYSTEKVEERHGLTEVMSSLPGSGLYFFSDCSIQEPTSLFSGLTHNRVTSLDVNIDLPPLTDSPRLSLLPHSLSSHSLPVSSCPSMTVTSSNNDIEVPDVWDLALKSMSDPRVEIRSWDKGESKPYLTDAECQVFDAAYLLRQRYIANMTDVTVESVCIVPERELVRAARYVTIGISSRFFSLDKQEFVVQSNVTVSGRSPVSLRKLLLQFAATGTRYVHLHAIASYYSQIGDQSGGLVRQAFGLALSEYLEEYRQRVINQTNDDATLMFLSVRFRLVAYQLRFLHEVCMCGPEHNPVNPEFPSGIRLLSYLFELARDNISSSHYLVLLSFLQSSCQPYFLFLQRWLFEGVLFDPYGEFMIQMNEQYLAFRDKNYWTLGYVAASKDCVPLFLSDLWKAILTCGKTVNLLKLCTRANPLCNMSISPPKISIHFSLRRLREVEDTSVWYAEHLRLQLEDAGHQRVLLREAEQKIKHQESLNQRQKMAEAIEMEDELKEKQRVEDESKKRALFETLKKQMEEDMQRRDSIEQQNREADLTWMNRLLAKEAAVDAAKRELEEHVRQELIEHYEQLAQDAARREARALWQASRTALSEARRQFLLADMNHWNTRDDVSDATLPHIQSPEKGETAKLVSPVETLNETISVSTETILGQTRKSNPVVYSPVGIIPGVFAVDEDPISLEEARRRIGIDSPNTDESETIKSDQDSVDTSQLTENIQLTLPFEYAEDAIENSSHSKDTATTYSNHPTESKNIPSSGGCDDNNSAIVSILVDRPESGRRQWNSDGQKLFPMSQDAVCIQSPVQSDLVQPSSRGHEPSSVVQDIMYSQSQGLPEGSRFNTRGMPPPSVVQDLIYAKSDVLSSDFAVAVSRGQEPCSAGQGVITESQVLSVSSRSSSQEISQPFQCSSIGNKTSDEPANMANTTETQSSSDDEFHSDEADRLESDGFQDRIVSTRGHEPPSVMQDIIYSQDSQAEVFRTTRGHAPKSTIQNLMYPKDLSQESSESSLSPHMVEFDAFNDPVIASFQGQAEPYDEGDSWLDDPACSDLMDKVRLRSVSLTETDDDHLGALNSLSLPELFNRSIAIPVATQVSVVNKAVVAYFIEDLCIQDHFQAIRHFLLLEDGEFGHALASGLFSKLSSGISSADLCSVGVMNNLLADSLGVSLGAGFDHMSCLSFSLKFRPQALNQSDIRALDFLELRYKVPWPVNIIITETAITKYGKLFTFMLQLKRATWALKDLGQRLKRSGQQMNTQNCEQLHKLNLFRREMQHFVTVMEGYVVNQIIHVSCLEFQQDLKEVDGLHGLRECHATYLNKMLYRSLLTKKAGPVLKVVHDILSLVLQFHTQLLSGHWRMRGTHPAFDNMCRTYARFKEFSGFLFTVVAKLVDRGYQPHLEDLLLRLNFNDYYSNQTTAR